MTTGLSHYVMIREKSSNSVCSYGGNQGWFSEGDRKSEVLRKYGCGLIGATDVLLHLSGKDKDPISKEHYLELVRKLERTFHVRNKLGINGIILSIMMNMYFLFHGMKYFAFWGVFPWNLKKKIRSMLERDIPVVFSAGPGYFRQGKLILYRSEAVGEDRENMVLQKVCETKDHYMTITGIYETKQYGTVLRITSWGKLYYVIFDEYRDYIRRNDNYLFSNILYIRTV